MKKYFVYLLESKKDGNFYIGQTDNLEARLIKHDSGQVRSTRNRKPFVLVGYIEVASRKEALLQEKEFKQHSDKKIKFIRQFKPDFIWGKPR
jgi:putative endonuclease